MFAGCPNGNVVGAGAWNPGIDEADDAPNGDAAAGALPPNGVEFPVDKGLDPKFAANGDCC